MKSVSQLVRQKIQLRKILMVIFSLSFVILICGILNTVFEDGNASVNSIQIIDNQSNMQNLDTSVLQKQNPREIHHDKSDRKIRILGAFVLVMLAAGSFIADMIFVRCPCCSKHLSYSINPEFCRCCGTSFNTQEQKR